MYPCHGESVASTEPNFNDRILALRPAVCTARMRSVFCVELVSASVNVSEQLDTVNPMWLTSGMVSEQPGQPIGTVGWNISSTNGVLSYISIWYIALLSCFTQMTAIVPNFLLVNFKINYSVLIIHAINETLRSTKMSQPVYV